MWYYFKTGILIAILSLILLYIGEMIGGKIGLTIALIFSFIVNFVSYYFSDKIILSYYRAKQINYQDYPELYNLVKYLADRASLPMPKIYIIDEDQPNAFATGRNPKNSAVAFTTGILNLLNKQELMGVIAHELAHIKNRDILLSTIVAGIATAVSYITEMITWSLLLGRNDENRNIFLHLITIIITPIIVLLIQLAVSRTREYLADRTGAMIVGNPLYLASALEKLDFYSKNIPLSKLSPQTSHLFIVNPESISSLFSTHPPIKDRIKKLREMSLKG